MNTLNSNENISVDIILSKTTQLAKQHKFLWIRGTSDNEISHLIKNDWDKVDFICFKNSYGDLFKTDLRFNGDLTYSYDYIEYDAVLQNRNELHLHTKLSDDISTIGVSEVFENAKNLGIKSIAFTNLNNVQDFPEIMRCAKKYEDIKVIYGAELRYMNESGVAPFGITVLVKNQEGIKELYKVISSIKNDGVCDLIDLDVLKKNRKNLLIGSCGNMGELYKAIENDSDILKTAAFYDYFEIYPTEDVTEKAIYKKICALGEELGVPVVASGNCHYMSPRDEICRRVALNQYYVCTDSNKRLYLHKTDAMLKEFAYLGDEAAYEAVVVSPLRIADLIDDDIKPLKDGIYYAVLKDAAKQVSDIAYKKAYRIYGNPLPPFINERLKTELSYIESDDIATQYLIAHKMGEYMNSNGYSIGSRGASSSVLVTFLLGVGDTNPLPPHYYCPHCHYIDFDVNIADGFDLPEKNCPQCDKPLKSDGHNIPYQTFMGACGDKLPDIDINVPVAVMTDAMHFIQQLFGSQNTAFADTIGAVSDYSADMYVRDYEEKTGYFLSRERREYIKSRLLNIKCAEGRHPAGIMVLPEGYEFEDFTPIRECDEEMPIDKITHFDFHALYDTILKIDTLGYLTLDFIRLLKHFTGKSLSEIKFNDPKIYNFFASGDTLGIPVHDTEFVINMLKKTKPQSFNDLVKISGLCHGTDVWLGNGEILVEKGHCLSELPALRDDVMLDLVKSGLDEKTAYRYCEMVRKGLFAKKKVNEYDAESFKEYCKPFGEWYFDFCSKVKYMFPKAHAVSYVINAVRCAYFKLYHPTEFYAAYFSTYFDNAEFDYNILLYGYEFLKDYLEKLSEEENYDYCHSDAYKIAQECFMRGISFLPPDKEKSHSRYFLPENESIRLPLFDSPNNTR